VVTIDYRVRGFTRDVNGVKHYIDHAINSIQNFMTDDTKEAYQMMDVNVYQENLFHTKMMLKETDLNTYLFGLSTTDLSDDEEEEIRSKLNREMQEIFYGRNLPETE
jgi:S-adenosylmethionine decarboxylase